MDFLTGSIKQMYLKYLAAAFGSALISSIYGVVDMAMIGQYQGPDGTAALAVVSPVWNMIYSLGLLMGIGGSVLFGGIFNIFGDYFFVFTMDLGITGAGLATAMGSVFSLLIMLTHFRSKKIPSIWRSPPTCRPC